MQRARSEEERKADVEKACRKISNIQLQGVFRDRANTRAFVRHYPNLPFYTAFLENSSDVILIKGQLYWEFLNKHFLRHQTRI